MKNNYALAIHGGAGTIRRARMTDEKRLAFEAALHQALSTGHAVLQKGGSATDAVEQAVIYLEDCELFNAGRGSVLNHSGVQEMEASIMSGHDLQAGAVTGVRNTRNPISLSRKIMENSPFVIMAGAGADAFAREQGLQQEPDNYFQTQLRHNQLQKAKQKDKTLLDHSEQEQTEPGEPEDKKFGTVGAVALDIHGNLAAATSTGGLTNKKYGRMGDSPVIGAGTYANNQTCAVSCTGYGEFFLRAVAAYDVSCLMEYKGLSLQQACDYVVKEKLVKMGGEGGLIAVDPTGVPVLSFNSEGMYRAWVTSGQPASVAIFADEA